jgi:hypothetical protein
MLLEYPVVRPVRQNVAAPAPEDARKRRREILERGCIMVLHPSARDYTSPALTFDTLWSAQ